MRFASIVHQHTPRVQNNRDFKTQTEYMVEMNGGVVMVRQKQVIMPKKTDFSSRL